MNKDNSKSFELFELTNKSKSISYIEQRGIQRPILEIKPRMVAIANRTEGIDLIDSRDVLVSL